MTELPIIQSDLTEAEFLRNYDPNIVLWKLSAFGLSRLDAGLLPRNLPLRAPVLMKLLKRLEIAEEDEIADHMILKLQTVRTMLKRLGGYGYVEQHF